jgi:hypothetical protein
MNLRIDNTYNTVASIALLNEVSHARTTVRKRNIPKFEAHIIQ